MTSFTSLGVNESFLKALEENNISTPTEVQQKVLPFLLDKGSDLIVQAQTGTGKTAAFGLPLLQKANPSDKSVQALILAPTRELCQQIAKQLFKFTKYGPKVFTEAVYGGAFIGDQVKALMRPTQIVVATPGRLIDLLEKKAVDLANVHTVVLDEADEMLKMGFKDELEKILQHTTKRKNTWLFSATMPDGIQSLIKNYMSPNAAQIYVNRNEVVNKDIEHRYVECEEKEKLNVLLTFLNQSEDKRGIIFCNTKVGAQTLAKQLLSRNIASDSLHGDLTQKERDKVMRAFKNEKTQLLIATDVAARGLDVQNLSFVVHYQLPDQLEYYTHRSGRTGRAGKKGFSLCLVGKREYSKMKQLMSELHISIKPYSI